MVAVTEPPGDFDYLWDDLGDPDDDYGFDDYDDDPYDPPVRHAPWYRTTGALLAICAIAGAVVAILVSAILLMSRNSHGPTQVVIPSPAPTRSSAPAPAPSTVATVPPSASESPSPSATPSAPVIVTPTHGPSTPSTLGGTSTPVTRSPLSVHPEPHPAFPHY